MSAAAAAASAVVPSGKIGAKRGLAVGATISPPKRRRAHAPGTAQDEDEGGAGDEKEADQLVTEMPVSLTGVPEPTTLLGVRNVTRGALVYFAASKPIGPMSRIIRKIRPFPHLWTRFVSVIVILIPISH
jgi:hypothetical protein